MTFEEQYEKLTNQDATLVDLESGFHYTASYVEWLKFMLTLHTDVTEVANELLQFSHTHSFPNLFTGDLFEFAHLFKKLEDVLKNCKLIEKNKAVS